MGYKLFNRETNQLIGSITDQDFKFLEDALEEESSDDNDYYIDLSTILCWKTLAQVIICYRH